MPATRRIAELLADTTIRSAAPFAPAACRVVGRVLPSIAFEVWLPAPSAGNGKFEGIGNAGLR